jgi:hypothetical protein
MPDTPALGLISMLFMRSAGELRATRRQLVARAANCGYRLDKLYVQSVGPPVTVFELLGSLIESEGLALVVPSLHHLAVVGCPVQIRDHLDHSGHTVLIANQPAERTC